MSVVSAEGAVGIFDLKNHLSAVLGEVMEGREITVTKHGRPIARIAPVAPSSPTDRAEAIAALHTLGARAKPMPDGLTVRDLIDEGRDS